MSLAGLKYSSARNEGHPHSTELVRSAARSERNSSVPVWSGLPVPVLPAMFASGRLVPLWMYGKRKSCQLMTFGEPAGTEPTGTAHFTIGHHPLLSIAYILYASPSWWSDAAHFTFCPARRDDARTGSSTEIRIAMIPMTTSSSIKVNPRTLGARRNGSTQLDDRPCMSN